MKICDFYVVSFDFQQFFNNNISIMRRYCRYSYIVTLLLYYLIVGGIVSLSFVWVSKALVEIYVSFLPESLKFGLGVCFGDFPEK